MPKITKPFSLNAYMFRAWLEIMDAAEVPRVHIRLIQALSAQPILGLPAKQTAQAADPSGDGLVLNISNSACRVRHVDLENGRLLLDISIGGKPCKDVSIPIEAIIEIYSPDMPILSSFSTGLPFATNWSKVLFSKNQVVIFPAGNMNPAVLQVEDLPQEQANVSGTEVTKEPKTTPPKRGHLSIVK